MGSLIEGTGCVFGVWETWGRMTERNSSYDTKDLCSLLKICLSSRMISVN